MRKSEFLLILESSRQVPNSEGYVDALGFKIYFKIFGKGRTKGTVLCLHGGPGATHDYLLPLADLADSGYQVVFYDMLGCGKSEIPKDNSHFSVDHSIEEIEEIINALKLENIHLYGHSWGGALAIAYCLKYQKNLKTLIVSSGFASVPLVVKEIEKLKSELPANLQAAIKRGKEIGDYGATDYRQAVKEFMKRFYSRGIKEDMNPSEHVHTLKNLNRSMYRTMWGPNDFTVTGTLRNWDVSHRLPEIKVPCLLTVGRNDEITITVAEDLHQRIKNSKLIIFENSSHLAMWEERESYLNTITRWLNNYRA
jgi:proline iminopeptidase